MTGIVLGDALVWVNRDTSVIRTVGALEEVAEPALRLAHCVRSLRAIPPAAGLVDVAGFEPATSSMPSKRAPNCATRPPGRGATIVGDGREVCQRALKASPFLDESAPVRLDSKIGRERRPCNHSALLWNCVQAVCSCCWLRSCCRRLRRSPRLPMKLLSTPARNCLPCCARREPAV